MFRAISIAWDYYLAYRNRKTLKLEDEENIVGKVIVITGANTGIGKALTLELAKRGATVLMCCRSILKATEAANEIKTKVPLANLDIFILDLSNLRSVKTCAEEIKAKYPIINILVNNAGVFLTSTKREHTRDGFEVHAGTNHLGHFFFTKLLLDNMKQEKSSRIVTVSSLLFKMADLNPDDLFATQTTPFGFVNCGLYSNSKLLNIYFTYELSKRLGENSGISTYAVCPGIVRTELDRNISGIRYWFSLAWWIIGASPEEGCKNILYCAIGKQTAGETGHMYRCSSLWENVELDSDISTKLWSLSENLVKGVEEDEKKDLNNGNNPGCSNLHEIYDGTDLVDFHTDGRYVKVWKMSEDLNFSSLQSPGCPRRLSIGTPSIKRKWEWDLSNTEESGGSGTWAISEIESEPFTFLWVIKNFTAVCKGSKEFESPVFKGGDISNHTWLLQIDPTETRGSLGCNLKLVDFGDNKDEDGRKISVRFEISVPKADGSGVPMKIDGPDSDVYPFSKGIVWGPSIGIATLVNAKGLVRNDTIKIQLRAWIVGNWKHEIGGGNESKLDMSEEIENVKKRRCLDLSSDMKSLYKEPVLHDVTLLVGETSFPAHKALLAARSKVFKAMFTSQMKESSNESTVEILDFDENTVKSMLEYIYTGETQDLNERASDLIRIANKYEIEGLQEDCGLVLAQNLNVENVSEIFVLADLYDAEILKSKAADFIKRNTKEVVKTDSFKIASDAQPKLFVKLAFYD